MIDTKLTHKYLGQKTVLVTGNFNIIHPGHVRLLRFAKSCGDILFIGLLTDQSVDSLLSYEDRREALLAMDMVDEVFALPPDSLLRCIESLRPNVVVKGREHEFSDNPERETLATYGGQLVFSAGENHFSSKDLIRRELSFREAFPIHPPKTFLAAHGISTGRMLMHAEQFSNLRALVIGDLIVDEYVYCDPLGMSQEDPTLVVTPVEKKRFIGGAGIVAGHVAGLGATVNYVSIVGDDSLAEESRAGLMEMGVRAEFIKDPSRPTTIKQRFRAHGKTLLRVSELRSHDAAEEYRAVAFKKIREILSRVDLVIFSDFNYGCLPQALVDQVIFECKKRSIQYFADSQASSQSGDIGRYVGATFIFATEREARLATNDFKSGVQNIANNLLNRCKSAGLLLKLGGEGLLVVRKSPYYTDLIPALNLRPLDVAGAGDAMLAAASLSRMTGSDIFEAAYLGSIAAAIQVSRHGNIPIEKEGFCDGIKGAGTHE